MIITIDGPAGAGKSTVAKLLAQRLKWMYLNTGSIYRALAWLLADNIENIVSENFDLEIISKNISLLGQHYKQDQDSGAIFFADREITTELQNSSIAQKTSIIAANVDIRKYMLDLQRNIAKQYANIIVDGRDMGTTVFCDAELKIYLTADENTRAQRRYHELCQKNIKITLAQISQEINARDLLDMQRTNSPLKPAIDAIIIDSTHYTQEEIVNMIYAIQINLSEKIVI